MEKNNKSAEHYLKWKVPEYDLYDKTRTWYLVITLVGAGLIIYSFFTSNFLFAVIVIIIAFILILRDAQLPDNLIVTITHEGFWIGRKLYEFDDIQNFSIVYKPRIGIKKLYLEFKNPLQHRLMLPIGDTNPLIIREILLKFISEDFERSDETVSEGLAKLFRL